ncbi:ImmA/IrrE family metallo-endopeptidase [Paraburkholderia sp. MMS20-SJTR3]|uniref:ImmA/IrrE family metallo-endopeptidase n=1 Tax=Paraburkholderia sejongensis TaxID=2886946 RepID=A0ABS8JQL8_9BURK|nr:ImmA/IrrE family metallo-endopeptidase [Paraburkholderia sp. MMS20-SJTR3]MCC8392162.1 ImmA/IrrE family metallo-endopeptidase [Paraburkholderia sp. MMS20-SJTR3]
MNDHEVAREIYRALVRRTLIYVPPSSQVKRIIQEERANKQRRPGPYAGVVAMRTPAGAEERTVTEKLRRPMAPAPVVEFFEKEVGEDVALLVGYSPALVADLKTLGEGDWEVKYGEAGKGSFVNRYRKFIILDSSLQHQPERYVQVLAHEVGHAMHPYKEDTSSKVAYLKTRLEDEAAATMNTLRTQREILANQGSDIGVGGSMSRAYNAAYDKFLQDGDVAACRELIATTFGNEVTSNTGQTYADYYGDWYDETYASK